HHSDDGLPPASSTRDPKIASNPFAWHKPSVRALVKHIEHDYGIEAITMTSYALPAFSAFVPDSIVANVSSDYRVAELVPQYKGTTTLSPWSNQTAPDGELIPWGKI